MEIEEITKAQKDLEIAIQNFNHATSEFIDVAIMELNACQMKLDVLLRQAKSEGVRCPHIPLKEDRCSLWR